MRPIIRTGFCHAFLTKVTDIWKRSVMAEISLRKRRIQVSRVFSAVPVT